MKRLILALMGIITGIAITSFMGGAMAHAVGVNPIYGALCLNGVAVAVAAKGSLAPAGALRAGLYPEVWVAELIKAFRTAAESVGWYNRIRSYDQHVDKDVLHFVDIGGDPDVLIDNTSYPLEATSLDDSDAAVKLHKFQTTPTRITDDELHGISYDKIGSVVERHKDAFSEVKFKRAIHSLAPAEHTTKTPVLLTTGDPVEEEGRLKLRRQDIISLKKAFDKARIPSEGRILVLCSEHVADLLEQDQKFAGQYYNYESGTIARLYGFDIYEYTECPYFSVSTKKKKAYGSVPAQATDRQASVAYTLKRVMRADGSTKTYMQEAATSPTTQENLFSMRTYNLCLPLKKEGLGAIVSAVYTKPAAGGAGGGNG